MSNLFNMLKETFVELLSRYTSEADIIKNHWQEVEKAYSQKERKYHTLDHLDNLLLQLQAVRQEIQHWDVVLFTLFYHDIVYNSLKSDNEEKSAEVAELRMKKIQVPLVDIEHCKKQILATKTHTISTDTDTNYFTDADLSILGLDWETYTMYYLNVRKEYSIYPDFMYNAGRKKVLHHFLEMPRIFKTDLFYQKFELSARENIKKEIATLS